MRDDARPGDVYGWSWPARPIGDDPYQWRGPVPAQLGPAAEPVATQAPVAASFEPSARPAIEADDDVQPPVIDDAASVDVWVELPPTEEAPRKGRARRGRGRTAEAESPIAGTPVEPVEAALTVVAPAEPEPVEPEAPTPVIAEAMVAEAAVAAAEPEAVEPSPGNELASRPIDANEIVAPPATPKRGWWRRGA
jgi:ribonuclease E